MVDITDKKIDKWRTKQSDRLADRQINRQMDR